MADNYLNKTGLGYYHNRVKTLFTNVIESIKVNGTALVPDANKAVDIKVPTTVAELTDSSNYALTADVPTTTSDLTNDSDFQNSNEVEAAIDAKLGSTYRAKGSCAFSQLPQLSAEHEGEVWNVSDSFTTTSDFVDGAGNTYSAGTNVVVVNTTGNTYKYDVLAGMVDLSTYWTSAAGQANTLIAITTAEIDAILNPQVGS